MTVKELLDWLMPRLRDGMKEQMSQAQVGGVVTFWYALLCWRRMQAYTLAATVFARADSAQGG